MPWAAKNQETRYIENQTFKTKKFNKDCKKANKEDTRYCSIDSNE